MKVFYHVSDVNLGNDVLLKPKLYNNYYTNLGLESPHIKRICVSDNISGALSSSSNVRIGKKIYVYRTESADYVNYEDVYRHGVPDTLICREYWLLKETNFTLYNILDIVGIINEQPLRYWTGHQELWGEVWLWDIDIIH